MSLQLSFLKKEKNKKHSENADTSTSETMTLEYELCLIVYSHMLMTLRSTNAFFSFTIPLIHIIKTYIKNTVFIFFTTLHPPRKKRFSTLEIISFFPPFKIIFLKNFYHQLQLNIFIEILDIIHTNN